MKRALVGLAALLALSILVLAGVWHADFARRSRAEAIWAKHNAF